MRVGFWRSREFTAEPSAARPIRFVHKDNDHWNMKLTVDIPDHELEDAIRFTKAKTSHEAVVVAITEFNRRMRVAELTRYAGNRADLISVAELQAARRQQLNPRMQA